MAVMMTGCPITRRPPLPGWAASGRRRSPGHPAPDHPGDRPGRGPGLPGRQAHLPAAPRHPAGAGRRLRGADPQPAGRGPAAMADPAARLGGGGGHAVGRAGLRRPRRGLRLPADQRDQPPDPAAAVLRQRGAARHRLDRAPGPQVPRPGVGAAQHAQAGELRAGPGQARPDPGQGRPLTADFAADYFHPGTALAAGRSQAAHRRARPDVTRARRSVTRG